MSLEESLKEMLEPSQEKGIEVEEFKVGGVFVDKGGTKWAIPADDNNISLREFRNLFEIPNRDPDIHYQFIREDQLNEFLNAGFVRVTRVEIGIPTLHDPSGDPTNNLDTTYYQVGKSPLVKIPKVIEQRRRKIQRMRADEATSAISVPRQMGKSAADLGVSIEHKREVVFSNEPQLGGKEFKEFEDEK